MRTAHRLREFSHVADAEPDAGPVLVALQCCVCGEHSAPSTEPESAARWSLNHLNANREHFTYRTLLSSPARAEVCPWL